MTHREALALIDNPYLRNLPGPTRWADLGCGSGTFTLALADLLAPGSHIDAIDLHPTIAAETTSRGVTITPCTGDFTKLPFVGPAAMPGRPRPAAPHESQAPIPREGQSAARGPAMFPLDGILMANSLHYVKDQESFLTRLRTATHLLLLVEYDTDRPVPRWVPYPASFSKATRLLQSIGWARVQKLGSRPSAFGRSELYGALALPGESLP